jgi:membrane-bound serine protease (ClpP class)
MTWKGCGVILQTFVHMRFPCLQALRLGLVVFLCFLASGQGWGETKNPIFKLIDTPSPADSANSADQTKAVASAKDGQPVELDQTFWENARLSAAKRLAAFKARSRPNTVYLLKVDGEIDLGLAPFIQRVVKEVEQEPGAVLLLDINTFGGRLDAAVTIRDALINSHAPSIAFINRRAISAGALIALSTDLIVMAQASTIGAATPVQLSPLSQEAQPVSEKVVAYFRSEMKATAESHNRPGNLAEAMVDADVAIAGVVNAGKLLSLTTEDARRYGLTELAVTDRADLLKQLNLGDAKFVEKHVNWGEILARILTNSTVSSILLIAGLLGIYIEVKTAGFGLAGIGSIICLALFFFGHYVVSLVGLEELLLFGGGLILLLIEAFLIPGFGVIGILGIGAILASLFLAMLGLPLVISYDLGLVNGAIHVLGGSIIIAFAIMLASFRFLPTSGFARRIVLTTRQFESEGFRSTRPEWQNLLDQSGIALTDLRPSGKALIAAVKYDVITLGDYIDKGQAIRVVRVEGMRIVVRREE